MSARRVQLHVDQIYEGLFDPVIKDISTRKFQYERIYEQSSSVTKAALAANTQLNFYMTNTARWFLPSQSYIYIQARVTDVQGGVVYPGVNNIAAGASIALQNNFPIFTNVNYLINNVAVEQQAQFYGVKHLIKNLLDYSDDNGNSYQDECWIRDTGTGGGADGQPVALNAGVYSVNPDFNSGYVKRQQIIAGSRTFTLRIPLWRMFDFLGKDVVYTGAPHTLTLFVNSNLLQLYIKAAGDATVPQMEIKNIFWEVPYVDPSPQVAAAILEKMAKTKSASWIYPFSTVYQYPNQAATPSIQWPITTMTERPYQVAVFIQSQTQVANANYQSNVQTFFTPDIANIYLTWGGDSYPQYQYRPSQTVGYGPGEAYATYLQLTNRYFDTEGGASINFADFQNLYTMYMFDMRYTGEDENPFAAGQNTQLNLSIAFNTNLPAGYIVWAIVYSEREATVNFADGKTLLTTK